MIERTERLAAEIRSVLGEILARGGIRDSRVRRAGLITITHVRVTGDLSEARVAFTVFGVDAPVLEQVRQGLQSARAYLQSELARRLRARKTATLSFEIDKSLDHSFHVNQLLRESLPSQPPAADDAAVVATDKGSKDGADAERGGDAPRREGEKGTDSTVPADPTDPSDPSWTIPSKK